MRILLPSVISLGLGASLRWANDVPWDDLLRAIVILTVALWLTAVVVTLWCAFAPCWERDRAITARAPHAGKTATT